MMWMEVALAQARRELAIALRESHQADEVAEEYKRLAEFAFRRHGQIKAVVDTLAELMGEKVDEEVPL
jgi:hypothetical protein